mmetsp:Transcript_7254/g.17947  ORF Transcript_7254/g.17947 Transcript_7254/m.17947 type:complete len:221 (+) Transcript_7254:1347-2009(+)
MVKHRALALPRRGRARQRRVVVARLGLDVHVRHVHAVAHQRLEPLHRDDRHVKRAQQRARHVHGRQRPRRGSGRHRHPRHGARRQLHQACGGVGGRQQAGARDGVMHQDEQHQRHRAHVRGQRRAGRGHQPLEPVAAHAHENAHEAGNGKPSHPRRHLAHAWRQQRAHKHELEHAVLDQALRQRAGLAGREPAQEHDHGHQCYHTVGSKQPVDQQEGGHF